MTPTGRELYNSFNFWIKRDEEILIYMGRLIIRLQDGLISQDRFLELMHSSSEMSKIILGRLIDLYPYRA